MYVCFNKQIWIFIIIFIMLFVDYSYVVGALQI